MFEEPDWNAAVSLLVEESHRAIEQLSVKHPAEVFSFFAINIDYSFGDVVFCLDTYDNGLFYAKRHEARTLKAWGTTLKAERGWESAKYYIQRERLCEYNPHTADFRFPDSAKLHFTDWENYFGNDQLPDSPDPLGHIIVLIHNVVDRLVAINAFDRLRMSSPFRVGVEFPRENFGLLVMRLLNWPIHEGQRV